MATFSEMLRDFGDMLDEAYHGIDSGHAGRLALSRSAGFKLSSRLVQNNSFFKAADSIAKEAQRIQKAIEMSSRFPEKYGAPHRYIEWKEKSRDRAATLFRRNQEAQDELLRITNPDEYHRQSLRRKYGDDRARLILNAAASVKAMEQGKATRDKVASIRDPRAFLHSQRIEEFGWIGASSVEHAEQQERIDAARRSIAKKWASGRFAYKRATMTEFDRKFLDLTMQYGGGEQGRSFARDKMQSDRDSRVRRMFRERDAAFARTQLSEHDLFIHDRKREIGRDRAEEEWEQKEAKEQRQRESRRSAQRRSRRAAVMREGLDDYQRFIHDNKGKYGREGAEQVFRQRLLKELPPFFKNSRLSTQQLINISKMMKSTSGIPIVGTLINHPMLAAIGALTAAARAFGSGTVGAIRETMPWVLGETVGGQVSETYKQSLAGVGVGEGEAIKLANRRRAMISGWQRGIGLDAWNRGAMFGVFPTGRMMSMNQEELVDYVSAMAMNIQDEGMRMQALSSYGVSHEDYVASLQRQGLAKKTNQNYIYQIAQRKKDERDKKVAKGAWIWKFLQPDWLIDIQAASSVSDPIAGDYYKKMLDNSFKTEEASESLKDTESTGGGGDTTNTTNNSHAIYISTLNVSADNPQTLVDQLYQMSGGNAYGENRAILASIGSGVIS